MIWFNNNVHVCISNVNILNYNLYSSSIFQYYIWKLPVDFIISIIWLSVFTFALSEMILLSTLSNE